MHQNVLFSIDNSIYYTQNDGVATAFSLGHILTTIFMVELERSIIPCLARRLNNL